MSYDDFIIMDIRADVESALIQRREQGRTSGGPFGTLSTDEILVARPRGMPVSDYISITTTGDRKTAQNASCDPAKIVARSMPVSLIRPIVAEDFDVIGTEDFVAAAKATGSSWGITDVLGTSPRNLNVAGVKIAILDTGIDPNHEAFAPIRETILLERRNFSEGKEDDVDGHGTHCAGTIFGRDVGSVRIGVAPGASDVLIGKVLADDGFGSTKSVLDALKWAHSEGANIISMSLGFDFPKMQKLS